MQTFIRTAIASAALTAVGMAVFTGVGHAQGGQTGLSKCYDSVVSACNKKGSDAAIKACVGNGLDQCDGQFKASSSGSAADISKLRTNALRGVQPTRPQKR